MNIYGQRFLHFYTVPQTGVSSYQITLLNCTFVYYYNFRNVSLTPCVSSSLTKFFPIFIYQFRLYFITRLIKILFTSTKCTTTYPFHVSIHTLYTYHRDLSKLIKVHWTPYPIRHSDFFPSLPYDISEIYNTTQ